MNPIDSKRPTPRWWVAVISTLAAGILIQAYRTQTGENLPQEATGYIALVLEALIPVAIVAVPAWFAKRDPRLSIALEEVERLKINGTVEANNPDTYVEPDPKPRPKRRTTSGKE